MPVYISISTCGFGRILYLAITITLSHFEKKIRVKEKTDKKQKTSFEQHIAFWSAIRSVLRVDPFSWCVVWGLAVDRYF